jgi:hypothetical protein
MKWIQGRNLLESPYNLMKDAIFEAIQDGILVPQWSLDGEWIKRYGFLDVPERMRRVFPNEELTKKYDQLINLQAWLDEYQEWCCTSDEEYIEKHRYNLVRNDIVGKPPLPDLETYRKTLPERRRRKSQRIQEILPAIAELEKELAPDNVWKNLDLGPIQQEILMEKLLEAFYYREDVESILDKKSYKRSKQDDKIQKAESYASKIKENVRAKAREIWKKDQTITICLLFKKVMFWICLSALVLMAACSSTQPWWKGKPTSQMTPAELEEQDPMFWRDWGSAHGLGR